jgi:hypothetical protein
MDKAAIAKDLLLGKEPAQIDRIDDSRSVKVFMRPGKNKRKTKKSLLNLAKYLCAVVANNSRIVIHEIDLPGEKNDFIVAEITCAFADEASSVIARWEQLRKIAFQ